MPKADQPLGLSLWKVKIILMGAEGKDFVGGKTTWCCHLNWGKVVQSTTSPTYEEGGSMVPGVGCKVTEDN